MSTEDENDEQILYITGSAVDNKRLMFKPSKAKSAIPEYDIIDLDTDADVEEKPCSQHSSGQTFKQCFKQEWTDFCDGFVGCLAQATSPIRVGALIGLHCAYCTR